MDTENSSCCPWCLVGKSKMKKSVISLGSHQSLWVIDSSFLPIVIKMQNFALGAKRSVESNSRPIWNLLPGFVSDDYLFMCHSLFSTISWFYEHKNLFGPKQDSNPLWPTKPREDDVLWATLSWWAKKKCSNYLFYSRNINRSQYFREDLVSRR